MKIRNLNIINAALILLIFPVTAFLVKDYVVYRRVKSKVPSIKVAVPTPKPRRAIQEYAPIVEGPVFPTPSRVFIPPTGVVEAALDPAASASGLKLVGTFVTGEISPSSFAVFEKVGQRNQKIFKLGEVVFGAGLLKEVGRERAVLGVGERSVTFVMEKRKIRSGAVPTPAPVNGRQGVKTGLASGLRYSKKTGENRWVISREAVLNALDDMGSVLTSARLTPRVKNGAVEGFLVTEIKPRGIMDAVGLKNGDILKRVNGYEMTSPERAIQVLTALKGETSFDLDIVRNGQPQSFHYEVR